MSLEILIVVILLQVLTFQFAVVRLSRALPDYLVGTQNLPAGIADAVAQFKRSAGRLRYPLGVFLMVAAIVVVYLLPLGQAGAKLGLTAISLISGAACAIGYLIDRRKMNAIAGALPEPAVRSASLRRDSLKAHYPPLLESLPLAIFASTVVATLWAWMGSESAEISRSAANLLVLPVVQGVYVIGSLAYTLWAVRSGSRLPQRSKAFLGTPSRAVGVEEALRRVSLGFFMVAKVAVSLMLGLMQLAQILVYSGRRVPLLVDLSPWVLVLLLLCLYLAFMLRTARLSKTMTP